MSMADGERAGSTRTYLTRAISIVAIGLFVGLLAYGLLSKGANGRIDQGLAEGKAPLAPEFDLPILETGTPPAPAGWRARRREARSGRSAEVATG